MPGPKARHLTQGPFKLHARNYGIVHDAILVVAFPSKKIGYDGEIDYGGTGQGMRIAQGLGIPLLAFPDRDPVNQSDFINQITKYV